MELNVTVLECVLESLLQLVFHYSFIDNGNHYVMSSKISSYAYPLIFESKYGPLRWIPQIVLSLTLRVENSVELVLITIYVHCIIETTIQK